MASSPPPPFCSPPHSPKPKCPHNCTCPRHNNPRFYLFQGMLTLPPQPPPPKPTAAASPKTKSTKSASKAPPASHPPRKPEEDPPLLHRSAVIVVGCTKEQTAEIERRMRDGTGTPLPLDGILDLVVDHISDSHGVLFRINKKEPEPGGEYDEAADEVFTTVVDFHDKFEELMDITWNLTRRVYILAPPSLVKNPSPSFDDPSAPKPSVEWWLLNKPWLDPETNAGIPGSLMIAFLPADGSGIKDLPPVAQILKGVWDSLEKPESVEFRTDGSMRRMTNEFLKAFLKISTLKAKAYLTHIRTSRREGND